MKRGNESFQWRKPVWLLATAVAATGALLLWLTWNSYTSHKRTKATTQRDFRLEELRGVIVHLDEVLAMSARMAAATGDLQWEQRYRRTEPKLNAAIKEAHQILPRESPHLVVADTHQANVALAGIENQAFKLVRQGRLEQAQALLCSDEYKSQKRVYALGMAAFDHARRPHMHLVELHGVILHLDEVLTMSARMAAATGDLQWEDRYRRSEPQLDVAIKQALELTPEGDVSRAVAGTDEANMALVAMENLAFDLVRQGRLKEAQALLHGDEYERQKRLYADGMEQLTASLVDTAGTQLMRDYRHTQYHLAATIIPLPMWGLAWVLVFRTTRRWQGTLILKNRRLDQQAAELRSLNEVLDQRVQDRTAELTGANELLQTRARELDRSHKIALSMMEDTKAANGNAQQANRQLQEAVQRSEQLAVQAKAASAAKSDFLANMSHEIRTPLTAVLGFADMLTDPKHTDAEQQEWLQVISRNGEHLLTLVNDILDLSRIEAGKFTLQSERCGLPALIAEVASMLRVPVEQSGLSLSVEYGTEIPETILADNARLRQVLVNLIGNAVKFTPQGGVKIIATFLPNWREDQPAIQMEIADTGIGIAPEHLEHLFDSFYQADASDSRRYGGFGLGVAITHRIIDMMGGAIAVESTPGSGSVFTVTIPTGPLTDVPMLARPAEAVRERPTAGPPAPHERRLQGLRVLLAEDGPDNQRLITALLQKVGAQVAIVSDGRRAVEQALAEPFDVVLMDMQMPEMDGYQATRLLREKGCELPIVALTARALSGDRDRCLAAGCTDYLAKPIDRNSLIETVAGCAAGLSHPTGAADRPKPVPPPGQEAVSEFADDEEMITIIDEFVDGLPHHLDAMRQALGCGLFQELQRLSHQLKGSGGSYGYPKITEIAKRLQEAAKGSDLEGAQLLLAELGTFCQTVVTAWRQRRSAQRTEP